MIPGKQVAGEVRGEDANEEGETDDAMDNQPLLKKKLSKRRYYKFDTVYFKCVIPPKMKKAVAYLQRLNKEKTERKLVFIYATVKKDPLYFAETPLPEGKEGHTVMLVVDRLERPADRYFKELEDDYWEGEDEPE